ncbi:MAG: hypothetical protein GAK28_03230 [Luteibacter sp.]|uniref:hypothetical protein n=1 Tax=Luteibacter sp. TaxID=1886636 RepID=UPI00138092CF|nr:hypothetical protein [Luteibacter sp.]KAF1005478.1 MAG: hypothetical protein GAK28_03230 [Luteibacter sp.]
MATIPRWPDTLPAPMIDGYAAKARPTFVRTEMDSGYARQRRRQVNGPVTFQQVWRISQPQLAILDAWFENQAFGGAAWVSMPVMTGHGKVYLQCRFTDTPDRRSVSGSKNWDISATLETYSKVVPNG